jgi:hypothetical protein
MFALPPTLRQGAGPQVSGLACPDCCGVLTVAIEGRKGHLNFVCRVGHVYALPDLLLAKEQVLEERLWSALTATEELIALLRDLETSADECWPGGEEQCRDRRGALEAYAETLRRVVEKERPPVVEPEAAP